MTSRNGNRATKPDAASGVSTPDVVEVMPFLTPEPNGDSPVARRRRDEIVTAATEVISTEGLHRLSLASIEKRLGMSRGQLTYYFPAKEDILLAVFDRMLTRMITHAIADAERSGVGKPGAGRAIDRVKHGFDRMMQGDGPDNGELASLVHTFMAQARHRQDYRQKIAAANTGWRQHLAADIGASAGANPPVPPAVTASIIMALFQGLSGQLAVDPEAFDRTAVTETCVRMLAPLIGPSSGAGGDS